MRRVAGHRQCRHVVFERTDITAGKELQVRHGPLQVEVRVVFPGEPDAPEDLDALLGAVSRRLERHRARDARAEQPAGVVRRVIRAGRDSVGRPARLARVARFAHFAPGGCGVPRHRRTLLDGHQHVGERVLDGLELADGPAELHAHLGVVGRRLETPSSQSGALRSGQGECERAHLVAGHPDLLRARDSETAGGQLDAHHAAGAVERRQRRQRELRAGTTTLAVEDQEALAAVDRHEHDTGPALAQHRPHSAAERHRSVGRCNARERGTAERHRRAHRAVGQPGQQPCADVGIRVARQRGGCEQRREHRAGHRARRPAPRARRRARPG